jgi:integrase
VKPRGNRPQSTLHPDTIKRVFGVVHAVFGYAVEQGLILNAPTRNVKIPTEDTLGLEPFSGRALSLAEVEAIATAAGRVAPIYGLLIRFLAATGLRAGELSGLRIQDVSEDAVRVARTARRDASAADGIRVGMPKSRTSRREVPILDSEVGAELMAHIANHPTRDNPDAPVFPSRWPGGARTSRLADPFDWSRPIDPGNFRRRVFDPACRAAGIGKIRLHDLRHTAGSLWLAAGVSLFNASRYLGHSSVDFTARTYGHVLETSARDDAARFAAYREGTESGRVIPFRAAR